MKTAALLAAASLLLASSAFAQSSAPPANVPPPPGINDPGVPAVAPPSPPAPVSPRRAERAPRLPSMQDRGNTGDSRHMTLPPQVSVHREGENEVQEYRRSGMLYRVVVTPKNGIQQIYDVAPDGTRQLQPGQPPVRPVMYKVLEWGKSKPAEAASSQADGGH